MKAAAKLCWILWQLPQSLLALFLFLALCPTGAEKRAGRVCFLFHGPPWLSGCSLGEFIFLPAWQRGNSAALAHEHGHSIQSRMLGPLYLLLVGIPSAAFCNLWDRLFHKSWPPEKRRQWYYSRYPEAWADRLGGVARRA